MLIDICCDFSILCVSGYAEQFRNIETVLLHPEKALRLCADMECAEISGCDNHSAHLANAKYPATVRSMMLS